MSSLYPSWYAARAYLRSRVIYAVAAPTDDPNPIPWRIAEPNPSPWSTAVSFLISVISSRLAKIRPIPICLDVQGPKAKWILPKEFVKIPVGADYFEPYPPRVSTSQAAYNTMRLMTRGRRVRFSRRLSRQGLECERQ